jgi:hypothetical protein
MAKYKYLLKYQTVIAKPWDTPSDRVGNVERWTGEGKK